MVGLLARLPDVLMAEVNTCVIEPVRRQLTRERDGNITLTAEASTEIPFAIVSPLAMQHHVLHQFITERLQDTFGDNIITLLPKMEVTTTGAIGTVYLIRP